MLNLDIKNTNECSSEHLCESDGEIKNKNPNQQEQLLSQKGINLPSIQVNKLDEPLNMSDLLSNEEIKTLDTKDPKV